jgi:acetylornithine deacetylase/succinyl-diaminopimelate desuccinylase-like protein
MPIRIMAALSVALAMQAMVAAQEPAMAPLRPDQTAFRELYKELVQTNTTLSAGSCTLAAEHIAAHLKAAGFEDKDITLFADPDHPKEGGIVAVLAGKSKAAKPMLLLGHLDVVEAKREDWVRDPFTLIEENGYFYGRGTSDMKAMDATWVDAMMRFKQGGYRPKRTIKMALTCGEETTYAFNGAQWLAKNKPELISAGFALNEGGGGRTDGHGKLLVQSMQVGEKAAQNYRLETTNPGGHSSIPIRDNAIYELVDALAKVRDFEFPVKFTDTTRAFFAKAGAARGDDLGRAMVALSQNPNDAAAEATVSKDRSYHSMLRTTCVATLLDAGHPGVKVTPVPPVRPVAVPPPLDPKILGPAEKLVAKYYPGVPLVPSMSTGATDGIFLEAIGIPVYGAPGGWGDPDGNGVHGLNERRSVRSVFVGRDFLTDLIKVYADAN